LEDEELEQWSKIVIEAIHNAMTSLSAMVNQEISISSLGLRPTAMSDLAEAMGGPEEISVGVYLAVSGAESNGHMMLLHEPRMACDFVDMMMMQPAGTTESLGDMERSALGELGNVVGSSFLNVLANHVGIVLHPSPPAVLMDMTGALLDVIAADIQLRTDRALVAEAKFKAGERSIDGMFLAVPSAGLLKTLRGNQFAA
jgi:chemotaxis protein CheC